MKVAICAYQICLPPVRGMHIHTTQLARALAERGHEVVLFCHEISGAEALFVPHKLLETYQEPLPDGRRPTQWRAKELFLRYYGVTARRAQKLSHQIVDGQFDICIYSGTEGLAWLHGLKNIARIWYAADDIVLGSLSQLNLNVGLRSSRASLREAVLGGAYEFLFRSACEAAWVVSERDRRWMSKLIAIDRIDNIPNGVDTGYFTPASVGGAEFKRIAFWGNLSFPPNLQALEWFVPNVWDALKARVPEAEFLVIGRQPPESLSRLLRRPGVTLLPDVPDLRPVVGSAPIAVFPIRSGAGIKNKVLEGASMARALVALPQALDGLITANDGEEPWVVCRRAEEWIDALLHLWSNPTEVKRLGSAARRWVEGYYTWPRAAEQAESSMKRALERAKSKSR